MPRRMLTYHSFMKAFPGCHPRLVDELELDELEWLPLISRAENEAIRIEQRREERMARNRDVRR